MVGNVSTIYASFKRYDYQTRTSNYTVDQTALASAAEFFTSDVSWTADGTSAYLVEAYVPIMQSGTAGYNVGIALCKGDGTGIVLLSASTFGGRVPVGVLRYAYTPAAGTQTINLRAIKEAGAANGLVECGAGPIGSINYATTYLAVYGPRLT